MTSISISYFTAQHSQFANLSTDEPEIINHIDWEMTSDPFGLMLQVCAFAIKKRKSINVTIELWLEYFTHFELLN